MSGLAALVMTASLAFAPEVELHGELVRLGDVADVSVLPPALRERAAQLPLARVEPDVRNVSVPGGFLAAQARAQLPMLAAWLPEWQPVTVRLFRREPASIARVTASGPNGVAKGDPLSVRIDLGPFHIEREARALGAARPGERLFLRTGDGQAILALCTGEGP